MRKNRILTLVTNENQFKKVGFRMGLWLSELTNFGDVVEKAGYILDIASPKGGKVPLDPDSLIISRISHSIGITGDVTKRYEDKTFESP